MPEIKSQQNMTTDFGKVAVLMGGTSAEREISIETGSAVFDALCRLGVDAHVFDTRDRTLLDLVKEEFNRAFIALHGRGGEDGTIQGALQSMGIPYTGSGILGSALAKQTYLEIDWSTYSRFYRGQTRVRPKKRSNRFRLSINCQTCK
jgi:D-alanine-D-alanine ligase-like ATP-grasp enzyme